MLTTAAVSRGGRRVNDNPGMFALWLKMHGFVGEARFHPVRKWRFDWSHGPTMTAVEIDGGVYQRGGGRHNRGAGYERDCEKLNQASLMGWAVLRFTTTMLRRDLAACIALVEDAMTRRGR